MSCARRSVFSYFVSWTQAGGGKREEEVKEGVVEEVEEGVEGKEGRGRKGRKERDREEEKEREGGEEMKGGR